MPRRYYWLVPTAYVEKVRKALAEEFAMEDLRGLKQMRE
eukprot:gene15820-20446_t